MSTTRCKGAEEARNQLPDLLEAVERGQSTKWRTAAQAGAGIFADLGFGKPNHAPLSPADFLWRTAAIHPRRNAVIHGSTRFSYAEFLARAGWPRR